MAMESGEKPPKSAAIAVDSVEAARTADAFSSAEHRKLIWKLDARLLPPLFILWFVSLIDRVNIGTARIQGLEKDLKMDPLGTQFNFAVGMNFDIESQ